MPFTTLLTPQELRSHLGDPGWIVVDCRFSLQDPERGRRAYRESHIPGARYAHLDDDLSAPLVAGHTGRHPLPPPEVFARTLSTWGVGPGVQVVVYDDAGGAIAARLWWMLGWLGHDAVAVLDGGWPRWIREGHPVSADLPAPVSRSFVPHPRPERLAEAADVAALQDQPDACLLDARSPERYRGEHEPIDPVAGHIPGARSAPFSENLADDGTFLPPQSLRARFQALLGPADPTEAICYCGSGVTAAHDLLALAHAGLGPGRLYAGSWSAWITDPERPVVRGQRLPVDPS